jgi:hypothetical protein
MYYNMARVVTGMQGGRAGYPEFSEVQRTKLMVIILEEVRKKIKLR